MASFSKKIELKYGIDTFEETKRTYEWIEKSARKWGGDKTIISVNFLFNLGDITCDVNSIQEFCEITYGSTGYSLVSFAGNISVEKKKIYFNYLTELSISADSRVELQSFSNILEKTSIDEQDELQVTYIESQINIKNLNNGTINHGDNNTVISQSSNVNMNTSRKDSKFKQCFIAVMQNILSNGIWYLLTAAIAALITYFSTRG